MLEQAKKRTELQIYTNRFWCDACEGAQIVQGSNASMQARSAVHGSG